jgi:murein DD-endopeptidase MepM/ murein hydrolase activator NlpD
LTVLVLELPYVNWHPIVPPLDQVPLAIRQDAKGDGRFLAPRSGGRRHRGVDVAAPLGSPVRAVRSGTVLETGLHRGLGRFVVIEHRSALRSLYAHLHEIQVDAGARVRQGEIVGTVGKTGNAKHPWITPHLHLEVTRRGKPLDPRQLGLALAEPSAGAAQEAESSRPAHADGGE